MPSAMQARNPKDSFAHVPIGVLLGCSFFLTGVDGERDARRLCRVAHAIKCACGRDEHGVVRIIGALIIAARLAEVCAQNFHHRVLLVAVAQDRLGRSTAVGTAAATTTATRKAALTIHTHTHTQHNIVSHEETRTANNRNRAPQTDNDCTVPSLNTRYINDDLSACSLFARVVHAC